MDHKDKILHLRSLIAEYDDDEDHHGNPTPAALEELVQKIKVVLNAGTEVTDVTLKNVAIDANSESNGNDYKLVSSSPGFSSQPKLIDVENSRSNATANKALENHDVLTEILKCVSFRDLNNFRLVNKQWKGVANSTIIKTRLWELKFKDQFRGGHSVKNIDVVLLKLYGCILASGGSFPLTTLDFSDVSYYNNLNRVPLLEFYALMGQSIKRVVFNNFGPLTKNEFQDLLMNKIPNVDHIDAGRIIFTNEGDCPLSLDLPNLKTIRLIDNKLFKVQPYYKDLLLAARNLKKIQDFHIQLTNIVMETGKVGCIQKLNLELLSTFSHLYAQFSQSEPKLTSLTITGGGNFRHNRFNLRPELEQSLIRILTSSKETLKHFQCLFHLISIDFKLPLPVFPNLESLTVVDSYRVYRSRASAAFVFLPGCDCREIFPKVHTVCLRLCYPFKALCAYFSNQTFPSVKTLEFQEGYQFEEPFKLVFPNVSRVKIIDYHEIVDEARRAARCFVNAGLHSDLGNGIESLEFHQCRLTFPGTEFHLDSRFSGAPRRRCADLLLMYYQRKAKGEDENITIVKKILEEVQTQHGGCMFRNFEGLRQLKIMFNHPDNANFRMSRTVESKSGERRYNDCDFGCGNEDCTNRFSDDEDEVVRTKPAITPVSCVYGFSLMPNLEQVIIGYDHTLPNASEITQVFEPFAEFPYVKIVHEPTDWNDHRK